MLELINERVEGLREALQEFVLERPQVRILVDVFDLLIDAYPPLITIAESTSLAVRSPEFVRNEEKRTLDGLREALRSGSTQALLEWGDTALAKITPQLREGWQSSSSGGAELVAKYERALRLANEVSSRLDREVLLGRANEALESIKEAESAAQAAAGMTGTASLVTHFESYAKGETERANFFRWGTIGVVAALIAYALFGLHPAWGEWAGFASRAAVLVGGTGLATYLARQSARHRHVAEWAKAIEVQLRTLPAFVRTLPNEDRSEVNRLMAQRALSAPPERGKDPSKDESPATVAQLIDLMTALVKRQAAN